MTILSTYRQLQAEGFLRVRHGAGAVVASQVRRDVGEEGLRRPLRTVLTQLILGGRSDREIVAAVRRGLQLIHQGRES